MKNLFYSILSLFFLAGLAPWACGEVIDVIVQGDNVNIRAKATNTCEVVLQKNFGDILRAKDLGEYWVEIEPPTGVTFYVFGDYLHENTVKARTLNVRAGPSGNYNIVGQLSRNDTVKRIQEKGDWVGIEPTAEMSLFVSRDLVLPKEKPKPVVQVKKPDPKPPVLSPPPPPVVVKQVAPPRPVKRPIPTEVGPVTVLPPTIIQPRTIPMPDDLKLLPVQGQGQAANRQGTVHSYLLKGSSPSRFYLSIENESGIHKVCYLREDDATSLGSYKGKLVAVSGWDYWVQGQKLPLMVIDGIEVMQ